MNQKRRKFDKWKIPTIIAPTIIILGLFATAAMWVNSTSNSVEACIKTSTINQSLISENKALIHEIEKAEEKSKAFDELLINKIDNLARAIDKVVARQDKIIDKFINDNGDRR